MKSKFAERADGGYEAELVDLFLKNATALLAGLHGPVDREMILALEPAPHALLDEDEAEEAYLAVADMIDMRMPFTFGHSRAVANLAASAAKQIGLPPSEVRYIRWAAYLHDIGELAVPVSTWMRPGAFTERETDAAHLHPYHGERALASLGQEGKSIAALVLRHHERLDGSGYHRYARANDLSAAARVLAAAEAFQTARETRPHRPASSDAAAAEKLRSAVRDGKLCPEAVKAVLACAGHVARRDVTERSAGLTPREIEVLRLIATGNTAKEAARQLEIAPKTADNHIQSLYSKIGVSTRAAAALYALERGLVH
jgi:putative nucleotidyltransferase with HDIG domain